MAAYKHKTFIYCYDALHVMEQAQIQMSNKELVAVFGLVKEAHSDLEDKTEYDFPTGAEQARLTMLDELMSKLAAAYEVPAV